MRRIDPFDAAVYILAQLSGGVLGALLARGLFLDEGRAVDYGTPRDQPDSRQRLPGRDRRGARNVRPRACDLAAALGARSVKEWAPLAIGTTLGFLVMVFGPLTGGSFNPARWFGPALVADSFSDVWVYILAPDRRRRCSPPSPSASSIEAGELEEPDTAPGKSDPAKPATPR